MSYLISTASSYVSSDVQVSTSSFVVFAQAFVDDGVEFHEACVLAQVVLGFAEEDVLTTIAAEERDFLGQL